jgi:hypothetical protein
MKSECWPSWLRSQFDKFLLVAMWTAAGIVVIHFIHHNDASGASWAREAASGILGALLLRITGKGAQDTTNVTTSSTTGNPPQTVVTSETK